MMIGCLNAQILENVFPKVLHVMEMVNLKLCSLTIH